MTNSTDYMTIEQASLHSFEAGQFWEFAPGDLIEAREYDDENNIVRVWELTNHAAITDFDTTSDDGGYRLWGNQYGSYFHSVEANIDSDTLVRLVDAR